MNLKPTRIRTSLVDSFAIGTARAAWDFATVFCYHARHTKLFRVAPPDFTSPGPERARLSTSCQDSGINPERGEVEDEELSEIPPARRRARACAPRRGVRGQRAT